jgi:dienelactone hydrolase
MGSIPRDMVRVMGAEMPIGKLGDFFIDKYEVTNKRYKEFVNAGGYRNKKYWKERFVRYKKELAWEDAIKEFVDQTGQPGPAGWLAGDYPEGQSEYPVSGVSWYEATAFAEFAGKSLPTGFHWNIARGRYTPLLEFPQFGGLAIFTPFSNFLGRGPVAVGSLQGMTAYGALDMAGNVREWCLNETPEGRVIRGGAWGDYTYMFQNVSQALAMDRSAKNGIRCALYTEPGRIPRSAFEALKLEDSVDFYKEKPVAESIFQVYREQFSYDRIDLHPRVEASRKSNDDWIQEKVSFDATYGGERIIAYLFLPTNMTPPYQAVIFVGGGCEYERSSQDIENYYLFSMFLSFIVKNGRAVLFPVYKGTFERGSASMAAVLDNWNSHQSTEIFVQQFKDFKRCIDYLQTRRDIDSQKLAYYGTSWGGIIGPIIMAVEERLKAGVLVSGGLVSDFRPEIDPFNYVTRVKTPTLMLNGRFDTGLPAETSAKPMFDLLGTPAKDKRQLFYDTDHVPSINEIIKETLAWLDKYLGPVKR